MTKSPRLIDLEQRKDNLTDRINWLTEFHKNGQLTRVAISMTSTVDTAEGPKKRDRFLSFWNADEIPTRFHSFLRDYCEDLIAEKLLIWQEIEKECS
jgi:hypothetical protein